MIATEYDQLFSLGHEVVHHVVREYVTFFTTIASLGRIVVRRQRCNDHDFDRYIMVLQRSVFCGIILMSRSVICA